MFSQTTLAEMRAAADEARVQIRARNKEQPQSISPIVAALETSGTAYACGLLGTSERHNTGALVVGAALHALAYFGPDHALSEHARAIGTGALAACAYAQGSAAARRTVQGEQVSPRAVADRFVRPREIEAELTVVRLKITVRR
jgi:hypothetical protein